MFGISRKKVADFYRATGKTKMAMESERIHLGSDIQSHLYDATAMPAVANLSAEEAIEALVGRLPPHHAEVLLLRVVADLSVEEVANLIGKSKEAVRVIQHRAINTLIKTFEKNVVT